MSGQRTIGVFCSSSDAVESRYRSAAKTLGMGIAEGGHSLVYGGGGIGLMGVLAESVQRHGGRVVGVLPEAMRTEEIVYQQADELIVTKTMRERKDVMDQRSDAFVALPGGFGTLEELLEVLTHRQLRYHSKPIIIVNSADYYDPLIRLFDHLIEHGFAKPRHRDAFAIVSSVEHVISRIENELRGRRAGRAV